MLKHVPLCSNFLMRETSKPLPFSGSMSPDSGAQDDSHSLYVVSVCGMFIMVHRLLTS